MLLKCLLIFGVILFVQGASIPKEIPVNVVYVEPAENVENGRGKTHVRYLQNRNLDEKVQLSGRELKEADLHLPIVQEEVEKNDEKLFAKAKTVFLEKLTNFRDQVNDLKLKSSEKKPTAQEWTQLNEKVQEVFKKYEGTGLRQNQGGFFQELTQATGQWFASLGGNNNNPSGQEDEQPANQGGLQGAWSNFQNSIGQAFSSFTNQIQNNNNNNDNQQSTTSNTVLGDTGVASSTRPPGFFQNLVSGVFNNNNNQGNKPSGQEDTGTSQPQNIFQGAINNFINTFNPPTTEKPAEVQGDTGVTPTTSAPGNFFQNIGSAFNQVFAQSTKPPGVSGDNAAENKPPSFFENFGSAIQNVFNQNNQNQESTTAATSTSGPIFIQQGLQQFQIPGQNGSGNIIEQFQNVGQQNFGQNIGQQLNGGSGNNQIQQITQGLQNPQNFATQAQNIGQQFGNNLTSGSNPAEQFTGAIQNPQNFASQAQNFGQQFGSNFNASSQNPAEQFTGAIQNPQNFASQAQNFGQQISGNIPAGQQNPAQNFVQQISGNIPSGEQNPAQNFANQAQNIGQQFSGNIPSGSQNPAQNFANQAQNIGQQFSGNIPSGSQNPVQNFASQAQNIGQQLGGNQNSNEGDLDQGDNSQSSVTNLTINQIPVLVQNPQNPLQNIQQQFQQNNVLNQIQSSTNQIQNPVVNNNNPLNIIDTQNQPLNVNQLNQVIPTNQFTNGVSQLNPQNGASTFISAPLNAATGIIQQSNGGPEDVKPVNENTKEKKAFENAKSKGEAEIMVAKE